MNITELHITQKAITHMNTTNFVRVNYEVI